jgi:hypothetical protein
VAEETNMLDQTATAPESREAATAAPAYQAPGYEAISLACEISAYAPDSGDPLF